MTIPVSQIVQVNPGVLAAAGSALDLNGLILTPDPSVPIGAVKNFATAADVSTFFGPASTEYQLALIYFSGPDNATRTPGNLIFAQYPTTAVGAYLRTGSFANVTLAQLQALTGILTINVNGTPKTSTAITLTGATSFSNAATLIQAAFTTPGFAVTYDAQRQAFLFQNTTTGAGDLISFATGTLAIGLKATQATGAVVSNGAAIAVPGPFMDSVVAVTQNWAGFMTVTEQSIPNQILFATWTTAQNDRYVYNMQSSDVNMLTAGNTTTAMYAITLAQMNGTIHMQGNATHVAFAMSWAASLDFTRLNGRTTLAFQKQGGLIPSVTNASDANAIIANGGNFYGSYATAAQSFIFVYPGQVSGQFKWADSYVNQVWLNANLQLAMINLLVGAGSVPYNAQGYSLINAACNDPLSAAVNFGAIRTGVQMSSSQAIQVKNALGVDVTQNLYAQGFYLQIRDASAASRVARTSPPMTLYYMDGGSVQQLTLASIEIQ